MKEKYREPLLVFGSAVLKIGVLLSLLIVLYLVIYNDIQSRKPQKCSCEREVQLCLDARNQAEEKIQGHLIQWNTQLMIENLTLRDRLQIYEDLPPN